MSATLLVERDRAHAAWDAGLLAPTQPLRVPRLTPDHERLLAAMRTARGHQYDMDCVASDGGPANRSWPC